MKTANTLVFLLSFIAINAHAQGYDAWAVSMGQNQTMNSAICNQSGTCKKLTPEQSARRKAISDQALTCIHNAHSQYRSNDPRRQQAVQQCKTVRDQQHAANMGKPPEALSAKKAPGKPKS